MQHWNIEVCRLTETPKRHLLKLSKQLFKEGITGKTLNIFILDLFVKFLPNSPTSIKKFPGWPTLKNPETIDGRSEDKWCDDTRPFVRQGSGLFKSSWKEAISLFFRELPNLPHDVPAVKALQQDDSDSALLANHVPLHNYPSIYCKDLFLIKSADKTSH